MTNILVRDMKHSVRQQIYTLLDPEDESGAGNDCRRLAELLGMPEQQIKLIWNGRGRGPTRPTENVLSWWGTRNNATVHQLKEKIREMPRLDVVKILDEEYGVLVESVSYGGVAESQPPEGNIGDGLPDYEMETSS